MGLPCGISEHTIAVGNLTRGFQVYSPQATCVDPSADAKVIFTADMLGKNVQGVKDPFIFAHGGTLHMFLSVALSTADTSASSHSTLDIYNTGECVSASALATGTALRPSTYAPVVGASRTRSGGAACASATVAGGGTSRSRIFSL